MNDRPASPPDGDAAVETPSASLPIPARGGTRAETPRPQPAPSGTAAATAARAAAEAAQQRVTELMMLQLQADKLAADARLHGGPGIVSVAAATGAALAGSAIEAVAGAARMGSVVGAETAAVVAAGTREVPVAAAPLERPSVAEAPDLVHDASAPGHAHATGGPAEVGQFHAEATPWNGRPSIGTISHVDGDRVEQYTGRNTWTSLSVTRDLGGVVPEVGVAVRIGSDGTMSQTPEQQELDRTIQLGHELGRGAD